MSAAAARRRKQQQKHAAAKSGGDSNDPVQLRLDALLQDPTLSEEAVAYEALQLAQSAVRRNVKLGQFAGATDVAYSASLALLVKSGRVSVSSQLLTVLVQVLSETHTECTDEWLGRFAELDAAYRTALDKDESMSSDERGRLQRLHLQFLKKGLQWSNDLGKIRFGAMGMHALLGDHCWNMSCDEAVVGTEAERKEAAAKITSQDSEEDDDEFEEEDFEIGLRNEAVSHYALAEQVTTILDKLKSLPEPTAEEQTMGHVCLPSQRDALLTRSILVLLAIENLRDARKLVSAYLEEVETSRTPAELKKSYLDKTDGKAPSHIMFVCMLVRICEKDTKTAPLFNWLVRNFGAELGTMHDPEVVKTYTTKIGRVYFDIQPPPNMMDMMENMMGMMGGGMGGAPGGGMNPMMAAMQAMQGGGM
mmetsp:Transcript_36075/g.66112  ORF Transcript_36075/g.66112 Transcript_36075/m.66112 type:complete len:420 (-) Transcript_36075:106-1365(-)|eukprot:CAMPEP_0201919364 /NCGR_PEP_ID=MMETSP0903-20130614/8280_1 /ASSEMBLY_ACC=CAM_ASM_000552 /TAXON_ID=420261 /ORGANISM="Thalassiosira antarctica, Strain CCMP982" /LENGTH=419 /DNA_ID=CAMNT_0048455877 /DNA_START=44 /DNA_END=1303 /DNA_ORIENTATION=-